MDPFSCLARLSPGDVIETDINGERVRVIVIRVLRPPEILLDIGMYAVFQFLDADQMIPIDTDTDEEPHAELQLTNEGFFFVGVEDGHTHLEMYTEGDERRAVLELAKFELIRKTRCVTSNEDPTQVSSGLWIVEIEGQWTVCTRSDNIAYGDNDTAAVFISTQRDTNGYTVFVMLDVVSDEAPRIFRPMTDAEQEGVYARFVSALYAEPELEEPTSYGEENEEPVYH